MNLAYKDIRHTFGKFIVTAMGVRMLLGIVLIMIGVYRGMIVDAKVLLEDIGADLWVVQEDTLGPFAESSRIHEDLKDSVRNIDGVRRAEALTFQNIQIHLPQKAVRVVAVGYDPFGTISPLNEARLTEGRPLKQDHYELVASDNIGLTLHQRITLGRDTYTVVGLTHGTVSSGGDPLIYISLKDAQVLQFSYSNERIRSDRARGIKDAETMPMANAVVADVEAKAQTDAVASHIRRSLHKSVYTAKEQETILTKNLIERASKQIGLFTAILVVVSTIIIALIIYTMTLEKMKEISIMKLIGLPNSLIMKMIVQETLLLGLLAFIFGNFFAHLIYDKFPKRVVLLLPDAWTLFGVVILASVLASLIGIKKVISADPRAAIGG